MAETDTKTEDDGAESAPKKKSKMPLILGAVLMLGLGGGGFFAAYSGMLDGLLGKSAPEVAQSDAAAGDGHGEADGGDDHAASASPDDGHDSAVPVASFVQLDPLVISLGTGASLAHLRFSAHLEVTAGSEDTVRALMPRVLDVLNSYLRALDPAELTDPTTMIRMRAQMLRRIQLVIGDNRVKDLLIAEFVLN